MMNPNANLEIYETAPEGFTPQVEVAACYLEIDGQILLLQKAYGEREGGTWGVPAGKLEKEESPEEGAKRELFEETGICIQSASQIQHFGSLYIRKPGIDYVYHQFKIQLDKKPDVRISQEHQDFQWVALSQIENLPLMDGAKQVLDRYQEHKEGP